VGARAAATAALVLAGAIIAVGRLNPAPLAWWAALAAVGFAVVGAPGRTDLAAFLGALIGGAAAMLVGGTAVAIGIAAAATLLFARRLDPAGWARRLVDALLTGLPLMYGAVASGAPAAGVVPWVLAAWLQLVRGLAAEVSPSGGLRRATVALALGFIPASLVLPARAGYAGAYFVIALFPLLGVLVVATQLIVGRQPARAGAVLGGAMVAGLVALIAGRIG